MSVTSSVSIPSLQSADRSDDVFGRFEVIRFLLITAVIYIHNNTVAHVVPDVDGLSASVLKYVINLLSFGVAGIAVPLFFFISGYLFFKDSVLTQATFLRKLKARTRTLLIPFLFWNLAILAMYVIGRSLPQTAAFFPDDPATHGVLEMVKGIFGIGRDPISYQFWFIRNLMILVLCAPVIFLALTRAKLFFFAGLIVLWLITTNWPQTPAAESLLFFSVGSYLAIHRISPFRLDRMTLLLAVASFLFFAISTALRPSDIGILLNKAGIVCGVPAALGLSRIFLASASAPALMTLGASSFFVFALHEPLLTMIRKVLFRTMPLTTEVLTVIYFVLPLVVAAICIGGLYALRAIAPKFASLITGGRAT